MNIPRLPLGEWGETTFHALSAHAGLLLSSFAASAKGLTSAVGFLLLSTPPALVILIMTALALWLVSYRFAIVILLGLLLVVNQGLWHQSMSTLSLVVAATVMSMAVALPLGIILGLNSSLCRVTLPVLEFVQTMPRFVYLIPAVVLLGIDVAPAIFATMTLAVPPATRLVITGLREVNPEVVEAARSVGCSPYQVLRKVKLPLAMPAILLGLNQCIMLSLSMTVIASLIGTGGLGEEVLTAISSLDAGRGVVAGLAIFVLAIFLDRTTHAAAEKLSKQRQAM